MIVIHFRSGSDLEIPRARAMRWQGDLLVCFGQDGVPLLRFDPAAIRSYAYAPEYPDMTAATARKRGRLNLLAQIRERVKPADVPLDRFETLRERLKRPRRGLTDEGNVADLIDSENREVGLRDWKQATTDEAAAPAQELQPSSEPASPEEPGAITEQSTEFLVSLLGAEPPATETSEEPDDPDF